jgi:hypothetical protein
MLNWSLYEPTFVGPDDQTGESEDNLEQRENGVAVLVSIYVFHSSTAGKASVPFSQYA